ncbi:hypothetical protein KUF83_30150 [Streptomyces sp. BV286]|uniref:hypothetical protein n=1 Tax=Streptomyces sp. BV286 TaxID=2849672 RepID=UPI001C2E7EC6|nr:hypothetical protein [Streptomyces sp. BV286]MBV1940799.1 hypothetical protein [Streptomyces sp. BV286]
MSEPNPSLPQTLHRIDELLRICGLDRAERLDIQRLSYDTGVPREDVTALLAGGQPHPTDADSLVRDRVRFLYEVHTNADGEPFDIRDIAAALGATTTWVKKLVAGQAKPSITAGADLARFYGVAPTFLTDSPAEAVNRELQSVVFDLEITADPEKKLKDLGVTHIAGRSITMWGQGELVEVAKMVADITNSLKVVNTKIARMESPEGDR